MPRRPNPEVLKRLLADGGRMVHESGFHASGVQDITAAAKVPKGSFYSYFDSKEAFASAILQEYWADLVHRLTPVLRDTRIEPLMRIQRFFEMLVDEHASTNFTIGCLIGNMSLELANSSAEVRSTLNRILGEWEDAMAQCITDADTIAGTPGRRDAHQVAAILIECWEGATLRTKVERNGDAFQRFLDTTLPLVLG